MYVNIRGHEGSKVFYQYLLYSQCNVVPLEPAIRDNVCNNKSMELRGLTSWYNFIFQMQSYRRYMQCVITYQKDTTKPKICVYWMTKCNKHARYIKYTEKKRHENVVILL